jgi:hypothetical protein
VTFDTSATALSHLMLGKRCQEARRRPTLFVRLEGSKNCWHFGAVADSVGWGTGDRDGGAAGVFRR